MKTMSLRKVSFFLFISGASCIFAISPTESQAPPPNVAQVTHPVYVEGEYWKFFRTGIKGPAAPRSSRDLQDGTYTVVYRDGKLVLEEFQENRLALAMPGLVDVNVAGERWYDFPIFLGKTWQDKEFANKQWRTSDFKVTGIESVTTKAGTCQQAYRIERTRSARGASGSSSVYYYCLEKKAAMKASNEGTGGSGMNLELIEHGKKQ